MTINGIIPRFFLKKTNVEEELVNEIGNEIQIFGPR